MLRIVCCVCVVVLFVSCNKNYRRLHIEKRVYRDGYYVHVPWERRTPVNEYPKPQPYPVDHSRTAQTDTTRKYVGGVPAVTNQTNNAGGLPPSDSPTGNGNSGNGGSGGGTSNANSGGSGGGASGTSRGQQPANGTNTGSPQPVQPVASYQPAPPLQQQQDPGHPPLQKPNAVPPVAPPDSLPQDSATAVQPADTSKERNFDFPDAEFSLVAELGFYNPVYVSGIETNLLSYNAGMSGRFTIHPWSRHKLSLEAGLFISQHFISQDHHKYKPMFTERHDHERVMQWKTRFLFMDHIYVNRNQDALPDAIELGVFSDIGFFSTHVAVDNAVHTNDAMMTRDKSRLFGLRYLRRTQLGMTARVANEVWSVFANYRFTQLVKASPDGGDLPRLVVGATFAFGG